MCRLTQAQITGVFRAVKQALQFIGRKVVTHQMEVKRKKLERVVSRATLKQCQTLAQEKIPEILGKCFIISAPFQHLGQTPTHGCGEKEQREVNTYSGIFSCARVRHFLKGVPRDHPFQLLPFHLHLMGDNLPADKL